MLDLVQVARRIAHPAITVRICRFTERSESGSLLVDLSIGIEMLTLNRSVVPILHGTIRGMRDPWRRNGDRCEISCKLCFTVGGDL